MEREKRSFVALGLDADHLGENVGRELNGDFAFESDEGFDGHSADLMKGGGPGILKDALKNFHCAQHEIRCQRDRNISEVDESSFLHFFLCEWKNKEKEEEV